MTKLDYVYPKDRNITDLSWNDFDSLVRVIYEKVKDYAPEVIIANSRGGMPLGVHLAHLLGVETNNFGCVSVIRHKDDAIASDLQKPFVLGTLFPELKGKRILITEDTVGTGETMDTLIKLLTQYEPKEIRAACLFLNDHNIEKDYISWGKVSNDYDWFIFPWEK